jgi:hypothetical protein
MGKMNLSEAEREELLSMQRSLENDNYLGGRPS